MSIILKEKITREQYLEEVEKWKRLLLVPRKISVIPYYGGKYEHIEKYLPYIYAIASINKCNTYIEMAGGGARFMLNLKKEYFKHIIYNEMDMGLCSLFQCVGSNDYQKLIEILRRLEIDKNVFEYAVNNRNNRELDILRKAILTYIAAKQSYNANLRDYSTAKDTVFSEVALNNISRAHEIMKYVTVFNGDCNYLLNKLGSVKHVIKMIDPPYHPVTRNTGEVYPCEMTEDEHIALAKKFSLCRSGLMCGYDPAKYGCSDYKLMEEAGAFKISMGEFILTSGQGKPDERGIKKEEFIWVKL